MNICSAGERSVLLVFQLADADWVESVVEVFAADPSNH